MYWKEHDQEVATQISAQPVQPHLPRVNPELYAATSPNQNVGLRFYASWKPPKSGETLLNISRAFREPRWWWRRELTVWYVLKDAKATQKWSLAAKIGFPWLAACAVTGRENGPDWATADTTPLALEFNINCPLNKLDKQTELNALNVILNIYITLFKHEGIWMYTEHETHMKHM